MIDMSNNAEISKAVKIKVPNEFRVKVFNDFFIYLKLGTPTKLTFASPSSTLFEKFHRV